MSDRRGENSPEPQIRTLALTGLDVASLEDLFTASGAALREADGRISAEEIARALAERERLGSTALGGGMAMPHARSTGVDHSIVLLVRANRPVEAGASDGVPVRLFVVVVTPSGSPREHLRVLARVSSRLRQAGMAQRLLAAAGGEEMLRELALPPGVAA